MTHPLLTTRGLGKRYGEVSVLEGIDFEVRRGEVHALVGANGAGKSTLSKIISGVIERTAGEMTLAGVSYRPGSSRAAERAGVQVVHQEVNLIPTLSIAENLFLSRLPSRAGVLRRGELRRQASRLLSRFGLDAWDVDTPVAMLGVGQRQMVEVIAALGRECRLLILDEPTAAIGDHESQWLFGWLRRLRHDGVAVIYISHRLGEVAELADRITILRDGRLVGTWQADALTTDAMVQAMTGEQSDPVRRGWNLRATSEIALDVRRLSAGIVREVSLTVRRGERLGVTGLVGAGRTELLRAIFGASRLDEGTVRTARMTTAARFRSPAQAVAAGIAMVTEDRQADGLMLSQSAVVNVSLAAVTTRFSRGGLIDHGSERKAVAGCCEDLEIRLRSLEQPVAALSGGNQQKVVVAKWLLRDADVFLFDEPTRGIDVAARRRIYRLLESLAEAGKAIVIATSDWAEIEETCDRVAVMSGGRVVGCWDRDSWSQAIVTRASFVAHDGGMGEVKRVRSEEKT